jgi:urea transport system permease protein
LPPLPRLRHLPDPWLEPFGIMTNVPLRALRPFKVARRALALAAALCLSLLAVAPPALAQAEPDDAALRALVQEFVAAEGNYRDTSAIVDRIAALGHPGGVAVLNTLNEGDIYFRNADDLVFAGTERGTTLVMADPITGEALGEVAEREATAIRVNNAVRRSIRTALGSLTLLSDDRATRLSAAQTIFTNRDANNLALLDQAIAEETDAGVLRVMQEARAAIIVTNADVPEEERIAAVTVLSDRGDQAALNVLRQLAAGEGAVAEAAERGVSRIETAQIFWGVGQNLWFGISLGSVLLLAAVGLAITFGVMGVINMAHGEMVMIGAYTVFVVQDIIRASGNAALLEWALPIAIPIAFLVTAGIGMGIERGVIRWLYGRPLETLLATFGISLALQQAARSIFGSSNVLVSSPSWMSGSFSIGQLNFNYSRVYILIFAIMVFMALILVLRRTALGLQMRAVTQNRRMASAMGIHTPRVDMFTFGLGSGIAGLAGVALSQIDNVSANLGQAYLVDSFMVVVLGGVGNLWGTFVGAFGLGVTNKFLEPYIGQGDAVIAKIIVLVAIIMFIQWRPRGLFALKGRAIES